MLYGYKLAEANEYGLLELKDISFATDSDTLRDLGRFFMQMADAMDDGEFERCSHRHIGSVIDGWSKTHDKDVIVMPPIGTTRIQPPWVEIQNEDLPPPTTK